MIEIYVNNDQVTIAGDGLLLARLPYNFKVEEVDLGDVSIDAQNLTIAADAASYRGIEAVKYYAAIRAKFLEQAQQALESTKASREEYENREFSGITSRML